MGKLELEIVYQKYPPISQKTITLLAKQLLHALCDDVASFEDILKCLLDNAVKKQAFSD